VVTALLAPKTRGVKLRHEDEGKVIVGHKFGCKHPPPPPSPPPPPPPPRPHKNDISKVVVQEMRGKE